MIRTAATLIAIVSLTSVLGLGMPALTAAAVPGAASAALSPQAAATTLVSESFAGASTPAGAWTFVNSPCLTAGTSTTPSTSLPACNGSASQDAAGHGALQLTGAASYQPRLVTYHDALPTANGLQITFTEYAFNASPSGAADGMTLFLTDANKARPYAVGQMGGSLGYAQGTSHAGVANAYIGVGLDEVGNYSNPTEGRVGGPGPIPQTLAVRGAASANYPYLGGAIGSNGKAESLPFAIDTPGATTRPAGAPTVQVTLTPSGHLTAAIDHHDGNGFVTYFASNIVGVAGQPAVPAHVYVGMTAVTGGAYVRHQVGNFTVTTIGTATPPPTNTPLTEPPQLRSANGALTFNVSAQADAKTGNPEFNYNGSTVAPTLRLLPGDTLTVNVTNHLPAPPAGVAYHNDISLHYHGLHVSPVAPADDSIGMVAQPGQSLHYVIKIPTNHPTGLYWYHSHAHGEAERQTLAGMSGALIIDGIAQKVPQVANLAERVLIVRDAPLPGQPLVNANVLQSNAMQWSMQHGGAMGGASASRGVRASTTAATTNPYVTVDPQYRRFVRPLAASTHCTTGETPVKALTINGQTQPAIGLAPGQQQFWRLVNAGADTYLDVKVDNAQLQIVAIDGVPISSGTGTPGVLTVGDYVVPPSSRIEFIVTGPAAGTQAYLRTNCFDAGQSGVAMPAAILAAIDPSVSATAVAALRAASAQRVGTVRLPAVRTARQIAAQAVARTQTLYYSDQNTINGVAYDPGAPPMFYAQSGTVEEWTIVNNSSQVHTFHIHQIHFVVEAIDGATLAQQFVRDNVNVPAATAAGPGTVKLRLDFTDPLEIGTFLLHCHILSHEDGGMMAKIRVGTAPPLALSATTVTFASAKAAAQTVTVSGGTAPFGVSGCAKVATASVSGKTITIVPAGSGSCVLTVTDSTGLIGNIAVTVQAAAAVVTATPNTLSFAGSAATSQAVALAGGTQPYSASGCANVAIASIASATVTVKPVAVGSCTLTFTDAKANAVTVAVSVNTAAGGNAADSLTFHHDAMRSGWYRAEKQLTTANVASNFGLIATLGVPGKVYAQPLYVSAETVANGSQHNLVVVATSTDQVYAYDDATRAVVWHRDFTNPGAGITQQNWADSGCSDINPDVGIIGTPVIDRARDTLYVVVATKESGNFHLRLHAISLKNGAEATDSTGKQVGPTEVTATYALASGGTASVSAKNNLQRPALLEANGNIYVGLGSHCDFQSKTTHGWMLAYSASTLQQTGNMLDLTNANDGTTYFLGAPWMSGYGPSSDAQGNVYFATGNGPFNGTSNFSMSILSLPGTLDITKVKYFTPNGAAADSQGDNDLGSGGVMLLPDLPGTSPRVLVAGGKCGSGSGAGGTNGCMKYLLNRDSLGGKRSGDSGALWQANTGGGMWGGPASFQDAAGANYVVYGNGAPLSTYKVGTAPLSLGVQSSANIGCLECRDSGSQPIVSSNGTTANTAVVWALKTPGNSGGAISLYAFDALNMGHTLFHATAGNWIESSGASWMGGALISPLVANGKVYVPVDGGVAVFGLH